MTGESPYIVGHRYFMVIGEFLSVTARIVWVGDLEVVCDEVRSLGASMTWDSDALARRYHIDPCSEQIVLQRRMISLAVEVL